jgi:drug/metabolite transporter (DMT)-like permease
MKKAWPKALILGIISSVFFSVTYVVNAAMAQSGGNWMWSASLRYLLLLPMLLVLTTKQGWTPVFAELKRAPLQWILWSTVGFGIFYAPLAFASAYGPSWMVAGAFQFTMLAGALETPLFLDPEGNRQKIPTKLFPAFAVIIVGIFLLQLEQIQNDPDIGRALLFAIPVLISASAYPLGNRKTMAVCQTPLTTLQRMLAMTIGSLPFWLLLSGIATVRVGLPSVTQLAQASIVSVFSGLIATLIFFESTRLVKDHPQRLALVESTQCGEVIFSLVGGILFLHDALPGLFGWLGLLLIVGGMIFNSLLTMKK